jgi:Mn2+/Fe2+ NRAMP family transporter
MGTTERTGYGFMRLGTSSVVVAAFVGPGTVLTCASAGINFGYALGWVLVFSTISVFVLQSLTAGTGILAGVGLGEAMRDQIGGKTGRVAVILLVVLGLWVGCAAFEMGNLVGAASGIASMLGAEFQLRWLIVVLGAAACLLLLLDATALVRLFTGLVTFMSLLFVAAFVIAPKEAGALFKGLLKPSIPEGGLLTVLALVGTTVVTYNLFLHPALCKRYWNAEANRQKAWKRELLGMALFLPLGGLISFAILGTGAGLNVSDIQLGGIGEFASLLEPVAGRAARILFGLGLFGAGITSAMTAPLAAASGVREIFGWTGGYRDTRFRLVWLSVIVTGTLFGLADVSPLMIIIAAQAANGILLPFIAGFMLYLANQQPSLRDKHWYFALGVAVTGICAVLGVRTLIWVWGQIF